MRRNTCRNWDQRTSIDSLTEELEKAREMAMNSWQPSAAVSATMGKAEAPRPCEGQGRPTSLQDADGRAVTPIINVSLYNPARGDGRLGPAARTPSRRRRRQADDRVLLSTCLDSIRTLPAMQHDQARPEDMDSNLEDHAADEWRYACMSRPWIKTVKEKRPERIKDAYERAVRESDGYRTV